MNSVDGPFSSFETLKFTWKAEDDSIDFSVIKVEGDVNLEEIGFVYGVWTTEVGADEDLTTVFNTCFEETSCVGCVRRPLNDGMEEVVFILPDYRDTATVIEAVEVLLEENILENGFRCGTLYEWVIQEIPENVLSSQLL